MRTEFDHPTHHEATIDQSTSRLPARARVLHEIFEAQADSGPDRLAVAFGREEVSYAALERRANRLAFHLTSRGIGRGAVTALLLPRSPDAYAALLGILKAGAAYLPLDPDCPPERIKEILADAGAAAVVTTEALAARVLDPPAVVVRVDADRAAIEAGPPERPSRAAIGLEPRDLCYLIYTSGSTGRPKGVMIEHRSACHFVHAERFFGVRPGDRVYQGFSLAFDASVEEIWLAFQAGATLVAATPEMARAGPDLTRLLREAGVTVLSCVPTLLAMLADEMPRLRLLILGGECFPEALAVRWVRPGLRVINTYGPTEATVCATYAELAPGRPVTIGRPLPGYRVHLLDDRLRVVPPGAAGEICIGGLGVARGYLGRAEETRARFVTDPFAPLSSADARLYRSGDRARLNAGGDLEFLGRTDTQVKIRGFRVELTEIEAVLLAADGVAAAACAVREEVPGVQLLVGYVVPAGGREPDEERLRALARSRLPAWMVPGLIETIAELPALPSGKLDRGALPAPRPRPAAMDGARPGGRPPETSAERAIAAVWLELFRPLPVSADDDFFLDLGGHSLLAARMVSELRRDPRFAAASVLDVYRHPTVAALAAALAAAPEAAPAGESPRSTPEARAPWLAGLAQSIGLYFAYGLRAFEWVTPYLVFFLLREEGRGPLEAGAWAAGAAVLVFPLLLLAAVITKWAVLGRIRPGRHPLWGWYYLRWWFTRAIISALPLEYLAGTPLLPAVFRMLGARIGRDVHLGSHRLAAFDLISIGEGACIDDDTALFGATVLGGELVLAPVRVGRNCFVGTSSVLGEDTTMEGGSRLEDLSLLPSGARIPRGETWAGSPARRTEAPAAPPPGRPARGPLRRAATGLLYAALVVLIPLILLAAFVPGMAILMRIDPLTHPLAYLGAAPLVGAAFVLCLTAEVAAAKWLLLGRVRAGTYPVHGSFYVRSWIVDRLMALSLDIVGSLHATLYLAPWYRALGAKLGRSVELSTATSAVPDLLQIGEESTIADEASLGAPRVEGGWLTLAPTRLGRRAFVGNSAVVPAGAVLGDESLVGVLSLAPADPTESARPGATWLGSPPTRLPQREPSAAFPEGRTFRPSRARRLARAVVEIFRVTLPPAGFILVTASVILAALALRERLGLAGALFALPVVYAACCAAVLAGVALLKWIVMGRFRPFRHPLWSTFIWRLEFVNALYEFLATPLALDPLQGTPFLPWYLRRLGARIGRGVYLHTTGFLEFDLVEIGDRAAVNDDCVLQTHLFEDRVLKASGLRIGPDCAVGALSVVLYESEMEPGARLDALSLLMKGERLPSRTSWAGIPAGCRRLSPVPGPNPSDARTAKRAA